MDKRKPASEKPKILASDRVRFAEELPRDLREQTYKNTLTSGLSDYRYLSQWLK